MTSGSSQIVITGAGLITPLGLSRAQTWDAIRQGRCGMGPLTALEQALPAGRDGGQCPDLPADFLPEFPREVRYLRRAIDEALADAGLDRSRIYPSHRCGVLLGTTLHGMRAAGVFLRSRNAGALAQFLAGATLRNALRGLPLDGLRATTCSACSSSLGAIAMGVSLLESGRLDMVVAGGYDTISEYVYGGFNSLRLVASGPLRPFTRDREGMKLAEGYGIVVLERGEDAAARGKRPLAGILGYGESADAHHLTQPHPQGEGAARAMGAALASANLTPQNIDMIAAHATGTPDNDAGEFAALSRTFDGELPRVPVVAFKSHLGHTLGGAGAVELILSALSLSDQIVPGCPNVREDQIEFSGLRVATGAARAATIRATLNTSLGFGGANACMILGPSSPSLGTPGEGRRGGTVERASTAPTPTLTLPRSTGGGNKRFARDVFITGVGVVLPGAIGNDQFIALLSKPVRAAIEDSGPIPESKYLHLLNARRVRRMSDYVKVTLAATMLACKDAGIEGIPAFAESCSAVLGSAHGSTNYSEQYYRQIVEDGIMAANPMLFAEGVPNAAAAHLSLMLSLKGPCQTVIGTRTAGVDALHLAATRIAIGECDRAIVGAGEEYSMLVNDAYRHWGLYRGRSSPAFSQEGGFAVGCGAVTLVLESASSLESRGAKARGKITAASGPVAPRALERWRHSGPIITSANGTWLDRLERMAARRLGTKSCAAGSLAGYIPECFSVTPLAGVAAGLLTRRFPGTGAEAPAPITHFCAVGSDYTGIVSAVRIELV
ncbi:MAG TPA: beta-ketoacyl-[acyl-carrier-protein] synthase family protein [Humisphaera sp.]|nr:beta-ketoacyl-[acyl-carrier-protein] synthase family protein [Humisphaera sp.]